ncbi:MAG: FAD-binding oxidoreductase [Candidatus Daviesbacteria bacterium]|nr:FAD-binding oxidoreductase [Candidatus Daviesbacteria bacterium]
MDLKSKLQSQITGEVISESLTLDKFSQDASIFKITPKLIVTPKDSQDIKKVIDFINNQAGSLSVTPRSGGTDMSGGPLSDSIVLDMTKYFNSVIKVEGTSATTQPGVYYRDFEIATLKHNLLLPSYTASREICTVGGMVANNSAGEKTLAFGQTKDYVKSLKVILADGNEYEIQPINLSQLNKKMSQKDFEGNIYSQVYNLICENYDIIQNAKPKVHKNSAGYYLWEVLDREKQIFDLTKLIVGSQGTLGIISEIEFKLIKPTSHSRLLVIFLKDLNLLPGVVNKLLEQNPESLESYDDQTIKVALKFVGEIFKSIKPKNFLNLIFQFIPEVKMVLTGGFPKLVLLSEFTGYSEQEAEEKCMQAQKSLQDLKVTTRVCSSEEESKKYWTIRHESFNLLRHHAGNLRTAPFIDDIVVKPEYLPQFLPKLEAILKEYNLIYTIAGHIGEGNFHIIPLMDFTKAETAQIIPELADKVYTLVFQYQGSMTGEHNDGLMRGPYLEKMYGEEVYQLFKQVKEIFDPSNIFNPHKKSDATFDYSFSHLVESHYQLHQPNS